MDDSRIWHLVARKLSREGTLEELRELELLLQANPELAYRVDVYARYYEHPAPTARKAGDTVQSWELCMSKLRERFPEDFIAEMGSRPSRKTFLFSIKTITAIAAGILCVMALAVYWYILPSPKKPETAVAPPVMHEMNTLPGTRTKLTLPDGTLVWLNSDSHLFYNSDFGKSKREVTVSGEAFFDVVHNAKVPMIVHVRTVNIKVLGTAFNVRSYPEAGKVETSLIRGSIELTTNADAGRAILLKPNEKITIETVPENKKTKILVPKALDTVLKHPYFHIDILKQSALTNTIPEVSWIDNELVFDNEPFADVVSKMEKWYNVEIVVQNKELAAKQVSGVFNREDISQALSALQMTIQFDFNIRGKKVFIR